MYEVLVHIQASVDGAPLPISTGRTLGLATEICLDRIRDHGLPPRAHEDELLFRIAGLISSEGAPSLPRRLLDSLCGARPRQTRMIAVLAYIDGLSVEEIANELGLSESRVRRTLQRLAQRWPDLETIGQRPACASHSRVSSG